jgi:Mg-chelatase subunit ChlD
MTSRRITTQSTIITPNISGVQPVGGYVSNTWSAINPHNIQVSGATLVQPVAQPANLVNAFKPKRAGKNPKLSHIIFVLDESSSMSSCWDQTIAGYNEYLKAQREDAEKTGIETLVSLYKFNGRDVKAIFDRQNVQEVQPLDKNNYRPSGSTNLHDAMGGVMMKINVLLAEKKKDDRESVIITVLTDGEENQSRTFVGTDIKAMVEKAEGKNWGFMFLGANIDAFHAGSILGFNMNNTMQFATANAAETMRGASAMTSRMKSSYASGMDTDATYAATAFFDSERSAAVGDKDAK